MHAPITYDGFTSSINGLEYKCLLQKWNMPISAYVNNINISRTENIQNKWATYLVSYIIIWSTNWHSELKDIFNAPPFPRPGIIPVSIRVCSRSLIFKDSKIFLAAA